MRRKEERSKHGLTNNKAKQHSTPKAVTFHKKNELLTHVHTCICMYTHVSHYVMYMYTSFHVYLQLFPLLLPQSPPRACPPHGHCWRKRCSGCWTWSRLGGSRTGGPWGRGRETSGMRQTLCAQTRECDPVMNGEDECIQDVNEGHHCERGSIYTIIYMYKYMSEKYTWQQMHTSKAEQ